jgi:hypothetical protein
MNDLFSFFARAIMESGNIRLYDRSLRAVGKEEKTMMDKIYLAS